MKNILLCFLTCFFIHGCKVQNQSEQNSTSSNLSKTNNIQNKIALICNLTKVDKNAYDGWDGDCPGTDVDANIFANFCTQMNIPYVKLENEQCTNRKIVEQFINCTKKLDSTKDGLFVFFYSGHGGQIYSMTESDGLDETLCFWDGQMRDDDVWVLLNKVPKSCRIFMVTDCCNSGSNYRLPYGLKKSAKKSRSIEPNMFHIGGCNDGEYSYGSSMGGTLSRCLKSTFDKNLTYMEWFNKVNSIMTSQQKPTYAETGKSFKTNKIFQ